ncbi:hypothetical protein ACX8XP_09245 [Calditrichota bacterium LG25]
MQAMKRYGLILVLFTILFAQNGEEAFNNRIRTLLNSKNYSAALTETWRYLEHDPFNVLARSWQVYIYLTREDSVQKAAIKNVITDEDPRYNFHLVLENIDFLRNASPENELASQMRDNVLQIYDELFGDLKIYINNSPLIGYFKAKVNLKIDTTSILSPIQKKRLEEINSYFKNVGDIYFGEYDQQKQRFYYTLQGVPKTGEFHGGLIYYVIGDTDSTFFEFNTQYQESIEIEAGKFTAFEYMLPADYVLLFFPKKYRVVTPSDRRLSFRRIYGEKQAFLVPVEWVDDLKLETPASIWQRYVIWGGMAGIFYWLVSTSR